MKTFYKSLVLVAVAATALVSCNKEIEAPVEEKPVVKSHVEFFAESVAPSTKATLTTEDEKSFIAAWEVTDQVSLYAYNGDVFDEEKPATWNETKGAFEANFETATPIEKQAWMYEAKYPYSADGNIPFGGARVQNGNAYNSAYDIMYGTVDYTNALLGKDDNDNVFVIPMNRLTGIAYFHITGGPDEDVVSATLEATGIAAENVTIASDGNSVAASTGSASLDAITITFADGTAPKATDLKLWFNVLPGDYTGLKLTVNTASKSAKLTSNKTMSYAAGKLNKAVLSGLKWNEPLADAVFFEERFTESDGSMGWSGTVASGTFKTDNENWITSNASGAGGAAKFGTGSKLGSAQTPSITIGSDYANEDILLSFKAGAWSGSSESTSLKVSATGATIVNDSNTTVSSVTLKKGEWTVYTLHLKDINSPISIKFEGNQASNSRFLLDDVLVYYGEKPAVVSLSVSPSEDQNVSYKEGSINYTVAYTVDEVASSDWSVATSSDGFSVAKTANGFTVTYSKNNGVKRTGEIVVTAGTKTQTVKIIQAEKSLTDELTASKIEVSSYSNWSDVSDITGVTYAGNSTKSSKDEIQLRNSSNSGIVSTSTIGRIKKIVVDWGSTLSIARTLDIYGSNTAYESSADLYDNSKRGTKLGSLTFTTSSNNETEFTVDGTYAYVGVRSNDGALYLNFIKFTYEEDNRQDPGMSWSEASTNATISNNGVTFTAPTLNPGNATSITYASTVPGVASIDASTGAVTIQAEGTTTIQAIFAGNDTYKADTKEYTLTVTDTREIVATPTFNPSAGEVVTNTVVTISSATQGATIYYTTDGSEPTTASTKGASVTITEDLTIKAIAVKDGYKDSEVASAAYIVTVPTVGSGTKDNPYTAGDILDKYPEGSGNTQVYVTGTITEITEVSTQFGNATYTISDGSRSILVYRGKYIDNAAFTSEDQIAVNDIVVVFGMIGVHSNAPQLAQNNYLISITADPNAPKLSVNPETTAASPASWAADNNDAKEFTVTATNGTWSFNANDVSSWANVSRSDNVLTVTPKEKQASEAHSGSIVITLTPSDSKYAAKSATIYLSQAKYSAGGTPKTSALTFTDKCNGSGTADDNVSWTVTSDGTESIFDDTKGIHYGTSSGQVTYIKLSTSGITGTITQVVVNASTASSVSATASVTVGGNAFGGNAQSLSTTASNYTFTGSAQGEIVVTVTKPSKATKAIYVKSVIVTYNN